MILDLVTLMICRQHLYRVKYILWNKTNNFVLATHASDLTYKGSTQTIILL